MPEIGLLKVYNHRTLGPLPKEQNSTGSLQHPRSGRHPFELPQCVWLCSSLDAWMVQLRPFLVGVFVLSDAGEPGSKVTVSCPVLWHALSWSTVPAVCSTLRFPQLHSFRVGPLVLNPTVVGT